MRTGEAPQDEGQPGDGGPAPVGGPVPAAASELLDTLRELGASGRATWTAGRDAATAFRILVSADISLARSAFGRTLAFTGAAIAFGASAWLLLMAALIAWLSLGLGWTWSLALLTTAGASLAVTALAGWMAIRYFEHTRMQATRRQLARLGIGELAGLVPDAGSGQSAEEGAEQVAEVAGEQPVKKGLGIDVTPP
jgi:hypothetical protein